MAQTRQLITVIVTIALGLVLFRAKEGISFHSVGFLLVSSQARLE
jgi:hypothetical protein